MSYKYSYVHLYVFIAYQAELFYGSVLHFVGDFEVHCKTKRFKSMVYKHCLMQL